MIVYCVFSLHWKKPRQNDIFAVTVIKHVIPAKGPGIYVKKKKTEEAGQNHNNN